MGASLKQADFVREAPEPLLEPWRECTADRAAYERFVLVLVRLCWQSLCTTILAQRVRVEEDIDDGTFTRVERVQLDSEFKRLEVPEGDAREAECALLGAVLKKRIRDLKVRMESV